MVRELEAGRKKGVGLPQIEQLTWLEAREVTLPEASETEMDLGAGERAVITLARALRDPLVLLDDRKARDFARRQQIASTGTLGILLRAFQRGLLPELGSYLNQLGELGFRLDSATHRHVLDLARRHSPT